MMNEERWKNAPRRLMTCDEKSCAVSRRESRWMVRCIWIDGIRNEQLILTTYIVVYVLKSLRLWSRFMLLFYTVRFIILWWIRTRWRRRRRCERYAYELRTRNSIPCEYFVYMRNEDAHKTFECTARMYAGQDPYTHKMAAATLSHTSRTIEHIVVAWKRVVNGAKWQPERGEALARVQHVSFCDRKRSVYRVDV